MNSTAEDYARRVMSGQATGPRAALLRGAMAAGSVPYACATKIRNALFDAGLRKPVKLPRPVVSIGNITTGGTGKTPVVRWLAEQWRRAGQEVAIVSRGYKAIPGQLGDEQLMLADLLNGAGEKPVHIRANPSRIDAAQALLSEHPNIDVFLLDDGFQHRQLARDFDLVLINAAEPFGFGHILPRGMLREPLTGLKRASAFLLTRCDQASEASRAEIRETLRRHNPDAPMFESVHAHTGFRTPDPLEPTKPVEAIRGRRWFAFCGIGDPQSFFDQLTTLGGTSVGTTTFPDHHAYKQTDYDRLQKDAQSRGAEVLITTEKDEVKLRDLKTVSEQSIPLWRVDMEVRFANEDEPRLLEVIEQVIGTKNR